jgi:diguanylate cyclase (GGDEF)-like protein
MPRSGLRPSLVERGKRLSTRAFVLALTSGVVVGVTGAAGQSAAVTSQPVSVQSAAFVRPTSGFGVPMPTSRGLGPRLGTAHLPADGVSRPTVIVSHVIGPIGGDRVPQTSHPTGPRDPNGGHGGSIGARPTGSVPTGAGPTGGPSAGAPTGDPGHGGPSGDPGHNGPTGDPGHTGPTGDPGHTGPTGDPGHTGPTGDPGQTGPTGDPGQTGPTGDHGHEHHHRHDGVGPGNSGQTNPPVPVPVSNPVPVSDPTPTPPPTHAPSQPAVTPTLPTTPVPPVTVTIPPVISPPAPPAAKGNPFRVSGLVPVASKPSRGQLSANPLLSANGAGLAVPLSAAIANLAHIASQPDLAQTPASERLNAAAATKAAADRAAATKAAAKLAADKIAAAKAASQRSPAQRLLRIFVPTFVDHIPATIWLALAGSIGLAVLGAGSAVRSGRRARRQADRVAEVAAVALTDPLTAVLNRRGFTESAERELDRAGRHGRQFVLAYIDVRGLKGVNDGEGHLAGDKLLKTATSVLTDSVRAHDVVGRLGGDEFGLLLTEQTALDAEQVTGRIVEKVASRRDELGFTSHWDLTVGLASFPDDGVTIDDLLAVADRRLYEQRGIALSGRR